MNERAEPRIDTATRLIRAAPTTIYDAFLDPAALATWLPPSGMTGEVEVFEPHEGGRFHLTLTYADPELNPGKSTEGADVVEGRFAELTPAQRISWLVEFESADPAFAGTMKMTWSLTPEGDATLVTIAAENVPAGIRPEDHSEGMASSLANLAAFVE